MTLAQQRYGWTHEVRPRLASCLDDRPRPSRKLPSFSFEPWHAPPDREEGPRTLANERLLVLGLLGVGHPAPLGAARLADLAEGELGVRGDDLGALRLAERVGRADAPGSRLGLSAFATFAFLGDLAGFLVIFLVALGAAFLVGVFLGGMVDVGWGGAFASASRVKK